MASDSSDSVPALKKEMEELKKELQCAVCLDILKKPVMILPCLHSFCSPCLDCHISSSSSSSSASSSTKCPVCRRGFSAEKGAIVNVFVEGELDRLAALRTSLKLRTGDSTTIELCDICDPPDKEDAAFYCRECNQKLCVSCNRSHTKFLKGHHVIDIFEYGQSVAFVVPSRDAQYPPCPRHTTERLNLYCLECEVVLCPFCLTQKEHQNHKFIPFSQATEAKRPIVFALIDAVEARLEEINASLSLVDTMDTKIQVSMASEKDKITTLFGLILKEVQERRDALLQELEAKSTEKRDRLAQQRKQLEVDSGCVENSVKVSRSILKNASDSQLSAYLPLISDQLTRLSEDKGFSAIPVETRFLEFFDEKPVNLAVTLQNLRLIERQPPELIPIFSPPPLITKVKAAPRDYSTISDPVCVFGTKGTAPGQFDQLYGLKADHENRILVGDYANKRVQIFDENGKHLLTIGPGGSEGSVFSGPEGIAVDSKNNIFVCDITANKIRMFDRQGTHIKSFGSHGSGNGQFRSPVGVAIDQTDRLLVCDQNGNRVQILDTDGNFIKSFGTKGNGNGQFDFPRGVEVDSKGRIIVCDQNNSRVQIFDPEGNFIKSFGSIGNANGQFKRPEDVKVDHQDNIIVCDWENSRIQVFDDQGNHIRTLGTSGTDPGQFKYPTRIAIDRNNRIIVADKGNDRIQIF